MEYNELMQGFAAKFGVAELDTKDGSAVLAIDDMTVIFTHDMTEDAIMLVVEIGNPPPDANGQFGSMMLKANYMFSGTGGAVICQNPETGEYALMRRYMLASLDVETFATAVEALINTAERWKGIIAGAGVAEREKESQDASKTEDMQFGGAFGTGGFMQV